MRIQANSIYEADTASFLHPQTNLAQHLRQGPFVIERGEGTWVYDEHGQSYVDATSGLWCASLGFSQERLARAAYDQMTRLGYYHSQAHYTHPMGTRLAERLVEMAPVPMSKALFQCSGSEANDVAIKLVWHYHTIMGQPKKRKIIGRQMGYHGSTCASISASGKPDMHRDFGVPLQDFLHVSMPHYYRFHEEGESEEEFSARLADELENLIQTEGPETIGGFIAEPVLGAGGAVPPPKGYFERVQNILRRYDILFIVDEVICGFGRTGEMWGATTYDLKPDMLSCAKALSAGMAPISAVLVNDRIFDALLVQAGRVGHFAHSATYCAHPVAAAVANEVLDIYEEIDVVARAREVGAYMMELANREAERPIVGDVRGVGMLCAIELTGNKATRAPLPDVERTAEFIAERGRAHGLLLRAIGPTLAFAPPLNSSKEDVNEIFTRFSRVLDDVELASAQAQ
ncbi:aminotransferase [Celeribacter persicus]|uniref:4-aminobutyrate--pyruvate transaminase n=1 Tax=Celeribacter persicus TaxID=1651082 RepID=A0A2T5H0I1_9RHOB|nr:aminotransferase [Celeribacter persicus]PTQ65081.1 4-aminobutyrate--pyruvate transaminase [Celeribacter persicus]